MKKNIKQKNIENSKIYVSRYTSNGITKFKNQKGYAILFTVVIVSAISVITAGLSNMAYKQLILSSLAKDSQSAFYQADTAGDCALYADIVNPSSIVTTGGSWNCGDSDLVVDNITLNGYTIYPVDEDSQNACFRIDVTKSYSTPPTPSWQSGLISWWKFDGDATDSWGTNHGTVYGATELTSTGCKSNQCYFFSGWWDKIDVGIIPIQGNKGSMSVWVMADDLGENNYRCAFGRFWSSYHIGVRGEDYFTGSWETDSEDWGFIVSDIEPDTNLHNIVLTYNGDLENDNLKMYIDGSLRVSKYLKGNNDLNDQPWEIGTHGNGGDELGEYWKGTIDEVMLWDRDLDSTEVQELYESFVPESIITTTIKAKGYNICNKNNLRTVEREIEINYE